MYFDHAATTPMDERLLPILAEHLREPLNPSSIHRDGQRARRLLEDARTRLAAALGVGNPRDIVFTSGATEAANLALRGLAVPGRGPLRIALSALEHACVHDTTEALAKDGVAELARLPVTKDGRVRLIDEDEDADAERTNSASASVLCLMHSNNETGVVQDVAAAHRFRDARPGCVWLCDASQSLGKVAVRCDDIGADLFVLSAHKLHGPPGIGCLAGPAVSRLRAQMAGGPQEDERRAGTQAVALALAFARAAELAVGELDARSRHLLSLEATLLGRLAALGVPFARNGEAPLLPGFLNISLDGVAATDGVIALDAAGFRTSPGSACSTGVVAVSRVLAAMHPDDPQRAAGGIRITFGKDTREADVVALADAIGRLADRRRNRQSPATA